MSLMKEWIAPGCIILLDDAHRPEERAIIDRWCALGPAIVVEEGATFAVLRVANGKA
jgi:hypothetical protein